MIKAEIVANSLSPQGDELMSVLATFPRIILAEVNTHRMLSKNTSSSRAIPFNKMVEAVRENPFIPIAFQKEHKGMQGSEYKTGQEHLDATDAWLAALFDSIRGARMLNEQSVTKQLCNRLLEPFMWTTMLITGSKEGWDNFFELRCPQYHVLKDLYVKSKKDYLKYTNYKNIKGNTDLDWLYLNKGQAEIHMMALAEAIYDARNESTPKQLQAGEWHIPFEDKIDMNILDAKVMYIDGYIHNSDESETNKIKISTAMAARTSYTVVGDEKEIDYRKMIELHDRLIVQKPLHASPMEHCARAMDDEEYRSFVRGCVEVDDWDLFDSFTQLNCSASPNNLGWCRNYRGFIQYRHILESK